MLNHHTTPYLRNCLKTSRHSNLRLGRIRHSLYCIPPFSSIVTILSWLFRSDPCCIWRRHRPCCWLPQPLVWHQLFSKQVDQLYWYQRRLKPQKPHVLHRQQATQHQNLWCWRWSCQSVEFLGCLSMLAFYHSYWTARMMSWCCLPFHLAMMNAVESWPNCGSFSFLYRSGSFHLRLQMYEEAHNKASSCQHLSRQRLPLWLFSPWRLLL